MSAKKKSGNAWTWGADPEVFVADKLTGQVKPICGLIGGTKRKPRSIEGMSPGYYLQEDNVLLEFNIPVAVNVELFEKYIGQAMTALHELMRTMYPHLLLDTECARVFTFEQLRSPKANEFGCAPDFGAHQRGLPWPQITTKQLECDIGQWRFAGGHIHIGCPLDIPPYVLASFCDIHLALPSIGKDIQGLRRNFYGQAGRYRPTSYGIEYRTLSNYWLKPAELKVLKVRLDHLRAEISGRPTSAVKEFYADIPWTDVATAINTENAVLANQLIAHINQSSNSGVYA